MKSYFLILCCGWFALFAQSAFAAELPASNMDQRVFALLDVLRSKRLLEQADYDRIVRSDGALEALVQMLLDKGVISPEQSASILYDAVPSPAAALVPAAFSSSPAPAAISQQTAEAGRPPRAAPPPLFDPLPLAPRQPAGPLTFRLGSGATASLDGFIKTSLAQASNESSGDDFPVFARVVGTGPETANSTGTTNKPPALRLVARSLRTGVTFWAPDVHEKFNITGRYEFDWQGNYSITTNNNIGALRSPTPRMRLAYVRLDTHIGKLPVFLKFGQDWTIFTSSTLPTGIEPVGVYVFQGVLWERLPGIIAGWRHDLGGAWDWKLQPEIGLMLPLGGEGVFANPANPLLGSGLGGAFTGSTTAPGQTGMGIGQREGAVSDRPHTEGRVVLQFSPFRHHPGILPSWFILSFEASDRARIFAPPFTNEKPEPLQNFILKNQSLGYSAEFRIATPWSTWLGKYYRGADLRQFFGGLAQDVFYEGPSPFGPSGELPRMRGVRSQGGFVQWQIPLAVLFHAERPALQGFSANLYYGQDAAFARDARRTGQRKAQHGVMGNLIYQYNRFLQFGLEVNWTEMLFTSRQGGALLGGHVGTDLRKEFSTTFSF